MKRRNFIINTTLSATGLLIAGNQPIFGEALTATPGKRIGIIGLDTSHSEVFTKIINSGASDMKGYKVVAAYPHGSKDIPYSLEVKPKITQAVRSLGVEIVDSIEALLSKVDVILLESNDGRPHLEQALPVFRSAKRVFIDKPISSDLAGAKAIFEAANQFKTPVFTSSALRFDVSVQKAARGSVGRIMGADVYTPAEINPHHSDMAWYAVHGVEMLFTVMGTGCKSVSRTYQDGTDMVVGVWDDGRIGTVRGIRKGASGIAGTAFGEKGIAALGPFASYAPLVNEIISFFETGNPPVSSSETLEIFKFIQAADESKRKKGKTVLLSKY